MVALAHPSDEPPLVQRPHDPNQPLDEDLYCLTCGYNLRGLSGDPIRCPECGDWNDLGTAAIPARYITEAFKRMETAPTLCTACTLICTLSLVLLAYTPLNSAVCPLVSLILFATLWWVFYSRMKEVYENQPGWRRILWAFHLTVLLCTLALPAFWILVHFSNSPLWNPPEEIWTVSFFVAVPSIVWGMRIYRRAQRRIAKMQREAAVRIARDMLRRALHASQRR